LPEIEELRPNLLPEFAVFASHTVEATEHVTAGIADAISFSHDGSARVVVDWKSDVLPAPESVERYREQVRSYLRMTGSDRGLIVFVTSGEILHVSMPT
jgi:ATP-dependent exoDNAse (exonuclease V) beta subunit